VAKRATELLNKSDFFVSRESDLCRDKVLGEPVGIEEVVGVKTKVG
jgi:hypothetical protein